MDIVNKLFNARFLGFRSKRADVFQRVSDRRRLTPTSPDDIVETNLRLEQVEGLASGLLNALASVPHSHQSEYEHLERLQNIPYRLAIYELMQVPGVGETRAHLLLKSFGSLADIYEASVYEIADYVPGIGIKLAQRIKNHLGRL